MNERFLIDCPLGLRLGERLFLSLVVLLLFQRTDDIGSYQDRIPNSHSKSV